jgi:hypothetical protein
MEEKVIITKCTVLLGKTPRWEGDCIHCSFMDIPPGMSQICPRCSNTVCAGHMVHHKPEVPVPS